MRLLTDTQFAIFFFYSVGFLFLMVLVCTRCLIFIKSNLSIDFSFVAYFCALSKNLLPSPRSLRRIAILSSKVLQF